MKVSASKELLKCYAKGLVWFKRGGLRLLDNAPLTLAHQLCRVVDHVCFIDPREFSIDKTIDEPRTGLERFLFECEALQDLQLQLQSHGNHLHLLLGRPEDLLPSLTEQLTSEALFYFSDIAPDEVAVQKGVEEALERRGLDLIVCEGGGRLIPNIFLSFHTEELGSYTEFRKEVEEKQLLTLLPAPLSLPPFFRSPSPISNKKGHIDLAMEERAFLCEVRRLWNALVDGTRFIVEGESSAPLSSLPLLQLRLLPYTSVPWKGGEVSAWNRLRNYIDSGSVHSYRDTRNELLGPAYSTKFSPYLSQGSLSSLQIYSLLRSLPPDSDVEEGVYSIVFHLLWRDYFQHYASKLSIRLFALGGAQGKEGEAKHVWQRKGGEKFRAWKQGGTGYGYVDSNMRELLLTGYMSNRGRQGVASFLVRDLGLDWRLGARYFESKLIDYDVCSNYGNWQYGAGVGADPRGDRYFNLVKQAVLYDPHASYIKTWCPELSDVPVETIHNPAANPDLLPVQPIVPLLHSTVAPLETLLKKKSKKQKKKAGDHGGIPLLRLTSEHENIAENGEGGNNGHSW